MTAEQQALFEAHEALADRIARGFPIPGEAPEFVQQEALLGLHKAVMNYNPERGRFEPFARMVILNSLRSTYGSSLTQSRRELTVLDEDPDENSGYPGKEDIADDDPIPCHEAERNEIRSALQRGLASLTTDQREVLQHYAHGGSFAELARRKGISEQAVGQMFERGLRNIRPRLEASGVLSAQMMPAARGGFRMLPGVKDPAQELRLPKQPHSSSERPKAPIALLVVGAVLVSLLLLFLAIGYLLRSSP